MLHTNISHTVGCEGNWTHNTNHFPECDFYCFFFFCVSMVAIASAIIVLALAKTERRKRRLRLASTSATSRSWKHSIMTDSAHGGL